MTPSESFIGCVGRAFCRDRQSLPSRLPIDVGCIDLPNFFLTTATRSPRVKAQNTVLLRIGARYHDREQLGLLLERQYRRAVAFRCP